MQEANSMVCLVSLSYAGSITPHQHRPCLQTAAQSPELACIPIVILKTCVVSDVFPIEYSLTVHSLHDQVTSACSLHANVQSALPRMLGWDALSKMHTRKTRSSSCDALYDTARCTRDRYRIVPCRHPRVKISRVHVPWVGLGLQ